MVAGSRRSHPTHSGCVMTLTADRSGGAVMMLTLPVSLAGTYYSVSPGGTNTPLLFYVAGVSFRHIRAGNDE